MSESTENPTAPIDDGAPIESGLSIDQPNQPSTSTFQGFDYDGAPPSEAPAAEEPAAPAGPRKMLRVDMGNGKYYTAETERELLQKVVDGKKEADRYIQELRQLKTNTAPSVTTHTVTPRTPVPSGDLPDGYDNQVYLNMLGEDPLKARRYQDRALYGDMDPVQALQRSFTVANQMTQQMIGAEFNRRNPDYIPSPESAEAIMTVLKENGLEPNSVPNLEWGYREAQKTGRLATPSLNAEGEIEYEDVTFSAPPPATNGRPNVVQMPQRQAPPAPQRRGANAPPSARGGGGGTAPPTAGDEYSMPLDQLRALIDSKGSRR
jgi:hypothetical protein